MSKGKAVIVKKVKKSGGGGHHGGAWKVAYADFVTAMMAFFLLMWLINMTSDEKRARLTMYFKNFSIFDSGGTSWMDRSSEIFNEAGETKQKAMMEKYAETVTNLKDMEDELKKGILNQLGDAKDQVVVDTVDGGVRIQMTDKDGSLMFETGSNKLTPKAKNILQVIGNNIKSIPSKVAIEGHTDALPYSRSDYSNWELSTERASTARKELEANGLDAQRIVRVSGFADKDPLIGDNPSDPRNRRISIILKAPDAGYKPVKVTEQPVAKKEEPDLLIKKFDENLSLVIDGAQKPPPAKTEIKSALTNDDAPPAKNWGAVIKKDEWSPVVTPVIKDALPPVIDKPKTNPSAKQMEHKEFYNSIQTSNTAKPAAVPVKKKETAPVIKNVEKEPVPTVIKKTPSIIKELASPIISKDDLFR
ncbi:MAG: OmpA family protein [Nitrospirae bacterium]|nr:OmpA family protein [Nitrospirota bacterium]